MQNTAQYTELHTMAHVQTTATAQRLQVETTRLLLRTGSGPLTTGPLAMGHALAADWPPGAAVGAHRGNCTSHVWVLRNLNARHERPHAPFHFGKYASIPEGPDCYLTSAPVALQPATPVRATTPSTPPINCHSTAFRQRISPPAPGRRRATFAGSLAEAVFFHPED